MTTETNKTISDDVQESVGRLENQLKGFGLEQAEIVGVLVNVWRLVGLGVLAGQSQKKEKEQTVSRFPRP